MEFAGHATDRQLPLLIGGSVSIGMRLTDEQSDRHVYRCLSVCLSVLEVSEVVAPLSPSLGRSSAEWSHLPTGPRTAGQESNASKRQGLYGESRDP